MGWDVTLSLSITSTRNTYGTGDRITALCESWAAIKTNIYTGVFHHFIMHPTPLASSAVTHSLPSRLVLSYSASYSSDTAIPLILQHQLPLSCKCRWYFISFPDSAAAATASAASGNDGEAKQTRSNKGEMVEVVTAFRIHYVSFNHHTTNNTCIHN
jgi:hypothetical protein